MTISSATARATASLILLGAAIAGLGFSCEKRVNDNSVAILVTVRASLGDQGQQGGGDVANITTPEPRLLSLSADGRYVAFVSKADDLVDDDNNGDADVFVRDMVSRTTVLVSFNRFNTESADGPSGSPSISADGRYVAFVSAATDVVLADGDALFDVFVRDLETGTTTLISRQSTAGGAKGDGHCANPVISADGRYVVFETTADNLDGFDGGPPTGGPDTDAFTDIYRRDFLDPASGFETVLISRADGVGGAKGIGASSQPRLSADGNFVVFDSLAENLVFDFTTEGGPDTNLLRDCFVRDVANNKIRRVSVTTAGSQTTGQSDTPAISADGRFVAFRSNAPNIHPDDDGPENDIFLYDRDTGGIIICSQHTFGTQAGNFCNFPVITGDGRFVIFQSEATSLVNGDSNSRGDVFRHDAVTRETIRLTVSTYGGELNGHSLRPAVSSDGRYVAFVTDATNAADDDSNGAVDVYLRGPPR